MENPMSHSVREQIKMYIKNKLDISSFIDGVCIRNEDLSGSIIKYMTKIDTDICNCNFANTILGSEDKIFSIIKCKMNNCNFYGAKFVGKAFVRHCEAHNCNFKNADIALADYQYTDFEGSTFCHSKICIDSTMGIGCKFPKEMFYDLTKNWNFKIKVETEQ